MPTYLLQEDGFKFALEDSSGFILLEVQDLDVVETPSGGWKNVQNFLTRQVSKDDIRRKREELGIVPKQAKKIDRVADDLIGKIDTVEPNEILVQIRATQEYDRLLNDLARRNAERRERIAEFVAFQIFRRVIEAQEREEAALVRLMLEL